MKTDVRWLEPHESPFGLRCVDCRPLSSTMVSTTRDVLVAQSFHSLRRSAGEQHRGVVPSDSVTVDCTLEYPYLKGLIDGPLFRASQMEEKWDVFLFNAVFSFARSWTGALVYAAEGKIRDGCPLVERIVADRSATGGERSFIVRQVDFLIKSHLYHVSAPHPIPEGFPDDAERIALYSFGEYGRLAGFATRENTIGVGW